MARSGAGHRTGRCGPVPAAARPGRTIRSWPPRRRPRCGPGWVGIAHKTGFGLVSPLAGIWPSLHLDTAITLPVRIGLVASGHVPAGWEHWPAPCTAVSCGDASRDSAATPSTPAAPGGSLRRPGLPSASPRSTRPVSMTMRFCQDCDVPSCCRHWHVSESGYGNCPAATPKAWTRTGSSALRVRRHMDVLLSAAMGRRPSASRRLRQAMAGEAIGAAQGVGQPVPAGHVPGRGRRRRCGASRRP